VIADRYRLGDVLGRSLMSEVRRGQDMRLRRPVAIKLLRDNGDPRSVARFEREAQILARLHHPNIVVVFDTGVDAQERFIVMELIEGPTLRQVLDEGGRVGIERASEIAGALASALAFAHAHDIVHRDVKPSNVLLLSGGGVKLVDVGIARLLSAEALTLTMNALGTARYMSPEQARGEPLDGRSDVYSLGCVLFEMLAGRTPFDGTPVALSYAHTQTPAPRLRSVDPAVPPALDDLVSAMLEKDPADRPQTGDDVRRALASIAQTAAAETTKTSILESTQIGAAETVETPAVQTVPPGEAVRFPPAPPARPPTAERGSEGAKAWPAVIGAVAGVVAVIVLITLLTADSHAGRTTASARSQHPSASPAATQASPLETASPTIGHATPEAAASALLAAVDAGMEAGEITDHFGNDIRHGIDEVLREMDKEEDVDKALEKVDEIQSKLSEAIEKGEITSSRASTIDSALVELAAALEAEAD
jgi:eukaryotic-like serine/threonine-protein kinase